jgi:hypothetical protein
MIFLSVPESVNWWSLSTSHCPHSGLRTSAWSLLQQLNWIVTLTDNPSPHPIFRTVGSAQVRYPSYNNQFLLYQIVIPFHVSLPAQWAPHKCLIAPAAIKLHCQLMILLLIALPTQWAPHKCLIAPGTVHLKLHSQLAIRLHIPLSVSGFHTKAWSLPKKNYYQLMIHTYWPHSGLRSTDCYYYSNIDGRSISHVRISSCSEARQ